MIKLGLGSALAAPINDFLYSGAGVFEVAAAYACHIARARAYLDGDKHTAACALIFLELDGVPADGDAFSLYEVLVAVGERHLTKAE